MWYKLAQQLQLPGLDVEQSQPKIKEKPEPKAKSSELLETQKDPQSLFFSDWAKGHYVPENPVYHGTTHEFDRFDIDKGSMSNYFGPAFYFTSDQEDASKNYTGTGPDQERNIENLQYDLLDQYDEDKYYLWNLYSDDPRYSREFNEDGEPYNPSYLAEKIARDTILGPNKPRVIPAHVRMKNPIHLTSSQDAEHPEKVFIDDVEGSMDFLGKRINPSDNHNLSAVISKLHNIIVDYWDYDIANEICEELVQDNSVGFDEEISASSLIMDLIKKLEFYDSDQDTQFKGDIVKRFLNSLGFDSIIMDPNQFFRMYSQKKPIKHYITWDPENIKHAKENIEFDSSNPVITAKSGKINLWKNSLL